MSKNVVSLFPSDDKKEMALVAPVAVEEVPGAGWMVRGELPNGTTLNRATRYPATREEAIANFHKAAAWRMGKT